MPSTLQCTAHYVLGLLVDKKHARTLALLVVLGDAILSQLIICFVSYTEIDWETYMYQIDLFKNGERNYTSIVGPTGPLVYPAGHVYVYEALHRFTDSGINIFQAQQLFAMLYTTSLALTCAMYIQAASVPNYVLLFLPLSKRLHSIYMLRLFNDCWSVVGMQLSVMAFGMELDTLGTTLFSLALSVKMSALLYFPGILVLLWRRRGIANTVLHILLVVTIQLVLAYPFLRQFPREYFAQAFDLSRVFLYTWTVNWRFLGEKIFLQPLWAKALLLGHVTTLLAYAHTAWCRSDGGLLSLTRRSLQNIMRPASYGRSSTDFIVTMLMTSNLIGIIFARSLHYQFYSWYAHHLPFLAWHTRYPTPLKLLLLLSIEYAWNVFPSTSTSSFVLLTANLGLLAGLWYRQSKGTNEYNEQVEKVE